MAKINVKPLLDTLGGTKGASGIIVATVFRNGTKAVRIDGETITFPSPVTVEFRNGKLLQDLILIELPTAAYWKVIFDADGTRDYIADVIVPGDEPEYDWEEMLFVDPQTYEAFEIIKGAQGEPGPQGPIGEPGPTTVGPQGPEGEDRKSVV